AAEPVPTSGVPGEARDEDPMPPLRSDRLSARSPRRGRAQPALPEMRGEFPDEHGFRQGDSATVEHGCRGARGGPGEERGALLLEGWFLRWLGRARIADAPARAGRPPLRVDVHAE